MNWNAYQELLDALMSEMIWQNCRAHALEYHMQYHFKQLGEDLVLFCYLDAMEQLGLEKPHW